MVEIFLKNEDIGSKRSLFSGNNMVYITHRVLTIAPEENWPRLGLTLDLGLGGNFPRGNCPRTS